MTWAGSPPPGWFPDPEQPANFRWWDGTRWTEYRTPAWQPPFASGTASGVSGTDFRLVLPPNRDVFAYASECLGVLSLLPNPVTSIAAIVCGILGLHRLKHSTQLGRGRAWFGIIAGVLSAALFALAFVALPDDSSSTARGGPDLSGYVVRPVEGPVVAPNADSVAECRRVLDSLAPPPAAHVDGDFVTLMRNLETPALPLAGYEHVPPTLPLHRYPDIDSYAHGDQLVDIDASAALLRESGFVVAEAEGFTRDRNQYGYQYGAEGIQFRNSSGADHYNRKDLVQLCEAGLVSNIRPVGGVADGVTFVRADIDMSTRASFVIGNTVVHLKLCSCFDTAELQTLVGLWARSVEERTAGLSVPQVGAPGGPSPVQVDSVARADLDRAAALVLKLMRTHPDAPITPSELVHYNSTFVWTFAGLPVGTPAAAGTAIVGTYMTAPPGPQYVVLALAGGSACYYVQIEVGRPERYGIISGADAASDCFIGQTSSGSPTARDDIHWADHWPGG